MSMHNRVYDHSARRLRVRQTGGASAVGSEGSQSAGSSSTETSQSTSSTTSTSSTEATTSTSTTTSTETTSTSTSTSNPPTTTSTTSPPTTSTTSTTLTSTTTRSTSTERQATATATSSTSTSSTSSSVSTTTSSSSSTTSAPATQTTPTTAAIPSQGTLTVADSPNRGTNNLLPTTFSSSGVAPSATETSAPATSGAINTGAVAGGVLGGIVGLAILGALIMMFIRRKRSQDRASRFDAAQFRRSAMIMEDPPSTSHSPTQLSPPPQMAAFQDRHQVMSVASTATGPGMAGQGAYAFQSQAHGGDYNQYNQYMNYLDGPNATYHDEPVGKNSAEYYSDSFSQQIQPPQPSASRQPIQERPQYTFGQKFGNVVSDDGHSDPGEAYGYHPQPQGSYNPEAYGNYYNPGAGSGAVGHPHAQDPNVRLRPGASASGTDNRTPSMISENAYGGI